MGKTPLSYMGVCFSCSKPRINNVHSNKPSTLDSPTYGCAVDERGQREKTEVPLQQICYIKMANTISNMKMTNPIKNLVSKSRVRYQQDGYNLDLTCILFFKQIISTTFILYTSGSINVETIYSIFHTKE